MAIKSRKKSSVGKALQLLVRFLGLNGLVAVAVGAVLWFALGHELAGMIVVIAGASAVGLLLLAEIRGVVGAVASHRGAAGFNVLLQVVLAAALLIGGNLYSFSHYKRYDCTSDKTFTLDEKIRARLAQLRGETDIIVYLQHVSFGQRVKLSQDEYDQAAEKIISKKIEDLVEQFSELGPRFRIHVLDTQKKNLDDRRKKINILSGELTDEQLKANDDPSEKHPRMDSELLKTIEKAPEDSIFFYAPEAKQLQRLSFNDVYQLDKKSSLEANGKKGNLVLIDQGVQSFAAKVFKVEEKKPRVGFAVVHGWLGQEGAEEYGLPALKKALATRGFDGRDIVLKKNLREPTAMEHAESRFEVLEAQKTHLEREIKDLEEERKDADKLNAFFDAHSLAEVNKEYVLVLTLRGLELAATKQVEAFRKAQGRMPATRPITEEFRAAAVKELAEGLEFFETEIASSRKRLEKATVEQGKLRVENLAEQRRITNVQAKFTRLLADVDLLVVPRFTLMNLLRGEAIPPRIHGLDDAHVEAIKDFMKAGKPVLFCLGPMNGRGDEPGDQPSQDSVEKLLAGFHIALPDQTILFNSEGDAMAEMDDRVQLQSGGLVEIPPAEFEWKIPRGSRLVSAADIKAETPIRTSLRLTADGLGENSRDGLKIRYPRPVYVMATTWSPEAVGGAFGTLALPWPMAPAQTLTALFAQANRKFDEKSVFLMTNAECWNEDRPFVSEKWTPHFVRPKSDDPHKGTVQEKRRGPFPIGVALEAAVPAEWYDSDRPKKPTKVRLAVIGDGAIFLGDKLSPMREKMFLDVANWLLGRENLLTKESTTWEYPRVHLEPEIKNLWEWTMRAGLPVLFLCLGINVWLVRRMR